MPVSLFIALRYLRSRRNRGFISFITTMAILGVTLGVASLIITLSILDGFEKTITDNLVRFTAHLQLFAFQGQPLKEYHETARNVQARFSEVTAIAPYVSREAMIRSDVDIEGVLVKGIEPSSNVSPIRERLISGSYDLDESVEGTQGVIVGKRLADKLELQIGQRVLVFALPGASLTLNQTRIMQFEVRGIYETGMAEFDESYVYMSLQNAQRLFQLGAAVSGFDILVQDVGQLPELTQQIPEYLGYPYYARSMQQVHRNLFTWIDLQKKPVPIILGLIIIVATVNIVGTLLMMVMEKTKEIGVLRTLGTMRGKIVQIFLFQGMLIGVVGTFLGNLLAYGLCWLELQYRFIALPSGIYYMSHVPIELNATNFALVSAVSLLLCFFSSLLPSRVAATLDPIRTLRFAS